MGKERYSFTSASKLDTAIDFFLPHDKMPVTRPEFEKTFPKLVDDVVAHSEHFGLPQVGRDWLRKV